MKFRSPLNHVLGFGSAKNGTDHWWGQRVSAVALLILGLWFVFALVTQGGTILQHADMLDWAGRTPNSILLILLVLTLAYHSSLGIQVIVEDYVHGSFLKVASLMLSKFMHITVALSAVFAILKLAFGATA